MLDRRKDKWLQALDKGGSILARMTAACVFIHRLSSIRLTFSPLDVI